MKRSDDFAKLFESAAPLGGRARKRLATGDVVDATVLQVGADWIFVDVGAPGDGRIATSELPEGERPRVGAVLRATVVDPEPDGPVLTTAFGRAGGLDEGALAVAHESRTPVTGSVRRALKGGLDVDVGGVSAFCPASHVELGYASDLESYVGRTLDFVVIELARGRSPVVSRRALLLAEQARREDALRKELAPEQEVSGVVSALNAHGAVIDLGGVNGFVPLGELTSRRVERADEILEVGESVTARVLSVEDHPKGLRIRLSLRRATASEREAPAEDEVLAATVVGGTQHGIIVTTKKGEGLVPLRELSLAPGEDPRRAFPVGRTLDVVAIHRDARSSRMRFSVNAVRKVEERKNVQAYAAASAEARGAVAAVGTLGRLLQEKLGVQPTRPEPSPPPLDRPKPTPADTTAAKNAEEAVPKPVSPPRSAAARMPPGVVRRPPR